jgi:hypothetical protein
MKGWRHISAHCEDRPLLGVNSKLQVALLPGKKRLYPLGRRVGGPQTQSDDCGKEISLQLPGF